MRRFRTLEGAFCYALTELADRQRRYIISVRAPREVEIDWGCTLQVVAQDMSFNDGQYGLTLHIPFDDNRDGEQRLLRSELAGRCDECWWSGRQEDLEEVLRSREEKARPGLVAAGRSADRRRQRSGGIPIYCIRCGYDVEDAVRTVWQVLRAVYGYPRRVPLEIDVYDQ